MLGNAVIIKCEAEGYPEPEITWLKGGNSHFHQYLNDAKRYVIKLYNFYSFECSMQRGKRQKSSNRFNCVIIH